MLMKTMFDSTNGGYKPFLFINPDSEAVYVRLQDKYEITRTHTNFNETNFTLIEVPAGKDI